MKPRIVVSIILCSIFLLLSVSFYLLIGYVNKGSHPGLDVNSFAPAKVKIVSADEDIVVNVYPSGGLAHRSSMFEANLNAIDKGWIVCQYDGKCRLFFEGSDCSFENADKRDYYYAEIIPRERLRVTDITARLKDEPEDPFDDDTVTVYLDCCFTQERFLYNYPRKMLLILVAANAVVILFALSANVMISKITKK